MDIRGKVHEIGATQEVSDSFKKRDLIIEYAENPTYPEYVRFETLQDKTLILDKLKVGDEVTVSFNLRGRPWTDKSGKVSYFNSLVAWKVDGGSGQSSAPQQQYAPPADLNSQGEEDDLPF